MHLGITAAQLGVLFVLQEHPKLRKSDLAEQLSCTKAAITALTERLHTSGHLRKTPCENDKRSTRLTLTPKGLSVVQKGTPLVRTLQSKLTEGFSDSEIKILTRFLQQTIETNQ